MSNEGKKVPQYPVADVLDGTEILYLVQNSDSKHTTINDIASLIGNVKLSDVSIDVSKDWVTEGINNLGSLGLGTFTPSIINLASGDIDLGTGTYVNIHNDTIAALIAQGDTGGQLHLVDNNAPSDEKWMRIFTSAGTTFFDALNDSGASVVTLLELDHNNREVSVHGPLLVHDNSVIFNGDIDSTPVFDFTADHGTPDSNTVIAQIDFSDNDNLGGTDILYSQLEFGIADATPSSLSGEFIIRMVDTTSTTPYFSFNESNSKQNKSYKPLDMTSQKIVSLLDPTTDQDAATKKYVDDNDGNTYARVVKKVDEIVNNSTTLQDDDELFVALEANKTYFGTLTIFLQSNATADFKHSFSIPTGATGVLLLGDLSSGPTGTTDITNMIGQNTDNTIQSATYVFKIIMSTTPGNVQYRWSQNTADVSNTTIFEGSSMQILEELP